MFFWPELPLSLYFLVLLLGTRSPDIEVLDTALEVLEVDVLEDDAIFDLRPEGPSRRAINIGDLRRIFQICKGYLESAGPYLTMGLNIIQKQYRNKIQTSLC